MKRFIDRLLERNKPALDQYLYVELGRVPHEAPAPTRDAAPEPPVYRSRRLSPSTLVALGQLMRGELAFVRPAADDLRTLARMLPEIKELSSLHAGAMPRVQIVLRGDELRVTLDGAQELGRVSLGEFRARLAQSM